MAAQRKKPTEKKTTTTKRAPAKKEKQDLTPLDYHAIQLHELFQAYKSAGFDHGTAITLICEPESHPAWFKKTTAAEFKAWDEELEDDEDND